MDDRPEVEMLLFLYKRTEKWLKIENAYTGCRSIPLISKIRVTDKCAGVSDITMLVIND